MGYGMAKAAVHQFVASNVFDIMYLCVGMMGYGMAKAAVHQFVASLSGSKSGLPEEAVVAAILP